MRFSSFFVCLASKDTYLDNVSCVFRFKNCFDTTSWVSYVFPVFRLKKIDLTQHFLHFSRFWLQKTHIWHNFTSIWQTFTFIIWQTFTFVWQTFTFIWQTFTFVWHNLIHSFIWQRCSCPSSMKISLLWCTVISRMSKSWLPRILSRRRNGMFTGCLRLGWKSSAPSMSLSRAPSMILSRAWSKKVLSAFSRLRKLNGYGMSCGSGWSVGHSAFRARRIVPHRRFLPVDMHASFKLNP